MSRDAFDHTASVDYHPGNLLTRDEVEAVANLTRSPEIMVMAVVRPDGVVTTISNDPDWSDPSLGTVIGRRRVSHVVPVDRWCRFWFDASRFVFGDTGRVADWTRSWKGCRWVADMSPVGGPVLGPFDHREIAVLEEILWLSDNHDAWAGTSVTRN